MQCCFLKVGPGGKVWFCLISERSGRIGTLCVLSTVRFCGGRIGNGHLIFDHIVATNSCICNSSTLCYCFCLMEGLEIGSIDSVASFIFLVYMLYLSLCTDHLQFST